MMGDWKSLSVYGEPQKAKSDWLLMELNRLTRHHQANCTDYRNILSGMHYEPVADKLSSVPYLAARLFKLMALKSVPENQVFKTLSSSGTTSQVKSRIFLDATTATLQTKVLVAIMSSFIGTRRLPMLIVDQPNLISDRSGFSARGAGVQGFSFLGRNHTYALNDDMSPNWDRIEQFFKSYGDGPIFIFGFTFMIWQHLIQPMLHHGKQFGSQDAFMLHGGGWKKLADRSVDNDTFKRITRQCFGHSLRVHNFYGMVEQIGSVFVECESGVLHAPTWADVMVRHPDTLELQPQGEPGLLQLLSFVPGSYPGHSLLTEDVGRILGEDSCRCGRMGKYFEVLGRRPSAEIRGCSDTYQQ